MPLRNSEQHYGSVAKFFHWLIAFLIICLLIIGFFIDDISDKSLKLQIINLHKLGGIMVLILAILRLSWRWTNPVPLLPSMPWWERLLEKTVKFSLYITLFFMPLSGWIFSTAGGKPPHIENFNLDLFFIPLNHALKKQFSAVDSFLGWTIIILLCLHIAGALKHHFINKDNGLKRMMPDGE